MNKLYIFCGIPFSGKTTLAKIVAEKFNYFRVDLDEVKFELFGKGISDRDLEQKDWNAVYQEMYKKIESLLRRGDTVIHDTGNFTKYERDLIKQIADKLEVPTVIVFVDTTREVAYERLLSNRNTKDRFDVDDGDFDSAVKEMEVPTYEDNVIVFHQGEGVDDWIRNNFK